MVRTSLPHSDAISAWESQTLPSTSRTCSRVVPLGSV